MANSPDQLARFAQSTDWKSLIAACSATPPPPPDTLFRGRTALSHAVEAGRMDVIAALQSIGANPNVPDASGQLPLHVASQGGRALAVTALLAMGAMPSAMGPSSLTPLATVLAAASRAPAKFLPQLLETIRALVAGGAHLRGAAEAAAAAPAALALVIELGADAGPSALLAAAGADCVESLDLLVRGGLDINSTFRGSRALHTAAAGNALASVQWLLAHGADPLAPNTEGSLPLHVACSVGASADLLEALLRVTPVDAPGPHGTTSLYVAVCACNSDAVLLCLAHGAHAAGTPAAPALHRAARLGQAAIAEMLIDAGASTTAQFKGWTPMDFAIQENFPDVVALLMERGVVPETRLPTGQRVRDIASYEVIDTVKNTKPIVDESTTLCTVADCVAALAVLDQELGPLPQPKDV